MRWGSGRDLDALERNLVWIVGSPRTGTTWLLNLLAAHPRITTVDEPLIGAHLGFPASATVGTVARAPREGEGARALDVFRDRDDYFFSARYVEAWRGPLRELVLRRLLAQMRDSGRDPRRDVLVVKEPHGSEGADILVDALPRTRLLVVVRDGRDVVDSMIDAVRPGSWASSLASVTDSADERRRFVDDYSRVWVERIQVVLRAQEQLDPANHRLSRYEDLLADPVTGVADIIAWLGLRPYDGLAEHVDRLAFDRVAAEHRGQGKFHRAASPGLWRDNLTVEEQAIANTIMGPTLTALGYPAS
jgi:hypothetical protein